MHMTIRPGVAGLGCEGCPGALTGCHGCAGLLSKLRKSKIGKAVKKVLKPIQKVGTKVGSPIRQVWRKIDPVSIAKEALAKKKSSGGGGRTETVTQTVYVPANYGAAPVAAQSLIPAYYLPSQPQYASPPYAYQAPPASFYVPPGDENLPPPSYEDIDFGPEGQPIEPEEYEFGYSGGEQEYSDGGEMDASDMNEEDFSADDAGEYMDDGLEGVRPQRRVRRVGFRGLSGLGAAFIGPAMPDYGPVEAPSAGFIGPMTQQQAAASSGPSSADISNILSSIVTGAASIGTALLQGKAAVATAKAQAKGATGTQIVYPGLQMPVQQPRAGVPGWLWAVGAVAVGFGVVTMMKGK